MTRADLEALPDDGWRHQLVDGSLVMTPAPGWRHQSAVVQLAVLLNAGCPPDLRVVVDPGDDQRPASLTAWELRGGSYVQDARGVGNDLVDLRGPFAVTVVPSALVT